MQDGGLRMNWPQWTWIALVFISLLLHAHDHGKPKTGKDNFWIALTGASIVAFLLWQGGFFG